MTLPLKFKKSYVEQYVVETGADPATSLPMSGFKSLNAASTTFPYSPTRTFRFNYESSFALFHYKNARLRKISAGCHLFVRASHRRRVSQPGGPGWCFQVTTRNFQASPLTYKNLCQMALEFHRILALIVGLRSPSNHPCLIAGFPCESILIGNVEPVTEIHIHKQVCIIFFNGISTVKSSFVHHSLPGLRLSSMKQ